MINQSTSIKRAKDRVFSFLKSIISKPGSYILAKGKPLPVKALRWIGTCGGLVIVYLLALDFNFLYLFGESPSIFDIRNPQQNVASEVYSEDGQLLGKYYYENRIPVGYGQISPVLVKTLIATEDERFYRHFGIDFLGYFAVIFDALKGNPRGASTLTQQLVKNLYKTRSKDKGGLLCKVPGLRVVIIKSKEILNAFKLEMFFSKEEIVTLYLNTVDFGNNAFGIKTAAKTYFDTTPENLTPEQCALLVGILKATTLYNPVLNKKRAQERRNIVLKKMAEKGIISREVSDSLLKVPLHLVLRPEKINDGKAFYFRQAVIEHIKPWLKEKKLDIYADGLRIYTTVNSKMQEYAENAVQQNAKRLQNLFNEHWAGLNPWVDSKDREIPGFIDMIVGHSWEYKKISTKFKGDIDSVKYYLNKKDKRPLFSWQGSFDSVISIRDAIEYNMRFLHTGFVVLDPMNGNVKAWVGGINFNHFKFDNVYQSKRQPGSTFKAFVYAAAVDNGYSPCDSVFDGPVTIRYMENGVKKYWSPHNSDWTFLNQNVTLKYAFARSLNSVTVQIAEKIGWKRVAEYANKMGITSTLDTFPSVCLGASDVSLLELATAYCPITNGGHRVKPLLVTRIEDRTGKVLARFEPETEKVLSDETAFLMQQLFLGTMTEPMGTTQSLYAYNLFKYNTDIGGKTGTSSNHSDGWFVGVTPKLIGASWVGGEERCIHFKTSALGEGAKTALPVYGLFMEKVLADTTFKAYRGRFNRTNKKISRTYTCSTRSSTIDSLKMLQKDSLQAESQDKLVLPQKAEKLESKKGLQIKKEDKKKWKGFFNLRERRKRSQ